MACCLIMVSSIWRRQPYRRSWTWDETIVGTNSLNNGRWWKARLFYTASVYKFVWYLHRDSYHSETSISALQRHSPNIPSATAFWLSIFLFPDVLASSFTSKTERKWKKPGRRTFTHWILYRVQKVKCPEWLWRFTSQTTWMWSRKCLTSSAVSSKGMSHSIPHILQIDL